eukprot:gnl/MRDRNA2_/MRDRNA2_19802_c0_seq1.p1 gnl/MRDRNA2_/MRDRNA2_19802_c0~~gnl/MRDRNA2_/MRDRNA2_19802_c0_seq1.p1  ORF type:complete len:207 (-),score=21.13 gnl/MRDRNA2_/MRDRNA2_19802_c0_seq1:114-734(-)
MPGIIGKKLGMTSVYDASGKNIPCTVIEAGPCVVTQVKTNDKDGYDAVQIGFGDKKESRINKPMRGHFKKSGGAVKSKLVEFRGYGTEYKEGDEIKVQDVFAEGEFVSVTGTSKGKGFQGVVKRHGFAGVGDRTHGQHNRERAPGSIGAASYPARVFKGMKMAGQMGNARTQVQNLQVLKVIPEQNIVVVKGAVPGHKGAYILIEK